MRAFRRSRPEARPRGQALVELALIFPLFIMLFFGIIALGIGVFYQQQLTNAARESARYASIHSATALCPTASKLDPSGGALAAYKPLSYSDCDSAADSWPAMTSAGRRLVFGMNADAINVAACWSGYRDDATNAYDAPPDDLTVDIAGTPYTYQTTWAQCTIDGADPTTAPTSIACTDALAATTVDQASDMSEGTGKPVANTVTAYACYDWNPPLAGFLLIPESVTLRAVITEPIERQQ
jgi:Flp pilus assembly protein TadG